MPRHKTIKISEEFTDKTDREEFFRLPRLEFLINEAKPETAKGIGKMVMNHKLEIPDRFSMEVPDNRMAEAGIRQGDFVIVHAGFAIEKLDQEEADERISMFEELSLLQGTEEA